MRWHRRAGIPAAPPARSRQARAQAREEETPCGPTIMPFQTVSVMSSPFARP